MDDYCYAKMATSAKREDERESAPPTENNLKSEDEDVQQMINNPEEVSPQLGGSSTLKQETPQPPCIKKEEEELCITQEGECLLGREEADDTKFPLSIRSVKTEDDEEKPQDEDEVEEPLSCDTDCEGAEVQILRLLKTIKHTQDQLVAKVNFLTSRLTSTPGPEVEMPANIQFPLEQLEAVEAFEAFLKESSNGPAQQRVISSLATIGGQDVKRVTWNILGRIFTDEVSHQINWKGVNNKKAFSRMATKTLLSSAVRKNVKTKSATDAEVTKHAIRWFNLAADRAARRRVPPPPPQTDQEE